MPFPNNKIQFSASFGSTVREVFVTDPESGVLTKSIEPCNKPLPSSRLFDIDNMIKAGVTLNEVNTKVLSSGVDLDELGSALSSFKPSEKTSEEPSDEE